MIETLDLKKKSGQRMWYKQAHSPTVYSWSRLQEIFDLEPMITK